MTTDRRSFLARLSGAVLGAGVLTRLAGVQAALAQELAGLDFRAGDARALARLRDAYLLDERLLYLNHASIGTTPAAVVEAHTAYLRVCESHPSLYVWGEVWRAALEEIRSRAAVLMDCAPDDLAVTHNTTEGFSVLAHGLPLDRGDEVLFTVLNHAGASEAWQVLAATRGFRVRRVELPLEDAAGWSERDVVDLHLDALRPETRVLVLPHIDNMIGLRHPVDAIARAARARGVEFVLVDGAQAVGMVPVSLAEMGVDAYATSAHKWLQAPKGLGLFYVSPALRERLPRMWFKTPPHRLGAGARAYEDYSTRAWPAVVALGDALSFQAALGEGEKARRYEMLWRQIREAVDAHPRLRWRSPGSWRLGSMIMAVEVVGRDAPALAEQLLEEEGVVMRAFPPPLNTLRIAPNLAVQDDALQRFLQRLG